MAYTIKYLKTAENDLYEIFDYIKNDNPDAAKRLLENINTGISKLEKNPRIGAVLRDSRLQNLGYRILIIDNYLVFYVMKKRIVQIRRVLHGARDYGFLV